MKFYECYNLVINQRTTAFGIPDAAARFVFETGGDEMAVTLAMLCADTEQKYSLKLIAGKAGMDNIVRWVHNLEDNGSQPFLRGNELIVTTGIGHSDTAWLPDFITTLKAKGAVGIVILIGAHIPAVSDSITAYCDKNAFPLFTANDEAKVLDMIYELCRRITGMEKRDNALNDALRSMIAEPSSLRSHSRFLIREGFSDESRYSAIAACLISAAGEAVDTAPIAENAGVRIAAKDMKFRSAVFTNKGILAAVCQNCTAEDMKRLCDCIKDVDTGYKIFIGVSESAHGLAGISKAYEQAEAAMISSVLSDTSYSLYRNIGIMKLILGVHDRGILRTYVNENLGKIKAYDSEHNTDLAHILRIYIENNSSVNEVAAIEKVHRNTVNSKIRTVRELLGHELDDISKSRILIAFLINDVLNIRDEKLNTFKGA